MPNVVTKEDHPDFIGGIVWSACELRWINERIQTEVIAEHEACKAAAQNAESRIRQLKILLRKAFGPKSHGLWSTEFRDQERKALR